MRPLVSEFKVPHFTFTVLCNRLLKTCMWRLSKKIKKDILIRRVGYSFGSFSLNLFTLLQMFYVLNKSEDWNNTAFWWSCFLTFVHLGNHCKPRVIKTVTGSRSEISIVRGKGHFCLLYNNLTATLNPWDLLAAKLQKSQKKSPCHVLIRTQKHHIISKCYVV